MRAGRRTALTRYGAPAAFLAAATVAVLLVRAGISGSDRGHGTPATGPSVPAATSTTSRVRPRRPRRGSYRLQAGDTLESVAVKFRTSVHQLELFNPGVQPTSLRIGQKLRVR